MPKRDQFNEKNSLRAYIEGLKLMLKLFDTD